MKKTAMILLTLLAVGFMAGCGPSAPVSSGSGAGTGGIPPSSKSETISNRTYTKEELIECFKSLDFGKDCTVTDCALATDSAFDLMGVVQYTDKHGNACNLAFINRDGTGYPIGLDASGKLRISGDSILTYRGYGQCFLSLADIEARKTYDYTVTYSYSKETNGTNFVVSSAERK